MTFRKKYRVAVKGSEYRAEMQCGVLWFNDWRAISNDYKTFEDTQSFIDKLESDESGWREANEQ